MINRTHVWFAAFVIIVFAAGLAAGVALDRAWGRGARQPGFGFRGGPGGSGGPGGPGMGAGNRGPGGRGMPGGPGVDGPPTEAYVKELDQLLALTADQKTRITAIIEARRPRLRTLRDDVSKKFIDEQQTVRDEIVKVLTPEQVKKLEETPQSRRGGPFGPRGRGPLGR